MPTRPISSDTAVEVRPFQAEDEQGVLEVLAAAFGRWPSGIPGASAREFFHWKHMACPFGPSTLIVAEADGAIIGCHAYMPWRLRAGRRDLATMRGVDLAVRPAYQRMGVSTAMRAAASFGDDVAFMWSNPNKQNRPGALNAGMQMVGNLPRFLLPRRPLRRTLWRVCARASRAPEWVPIEAGTAAEVLRDPVHASLLLAETKWPAGRMATVKALDYLRWRYGHFKEYRAITTDSAAARGIAIFRMRRHERFWVSDVCELLVEGDDGHTARRLLHGVRDAAPADFTSCGFSSRRHAARFGFMQTRGVTDLMTLPLQQDLAPDPTQRASWALSRGDLELL
jgi:GNAT superfamily N-acetyltransferase